MRKASRSMLFAVIVFSVAMATEAQEAKVPRLGVVASGHTTTTPWYEAFRQGLRDRGYIEGQNLLIEYRYGEGKLDRMPVLVNELVKQQVDVLFVTNQVAIRAAKKATNKIPIVMITSVDPVTAGLVDSLAHPGGNLTGLSSLSRDLSPKRLELLKEILPRTTRIAILWDSEGPGPRVAFKEYETAAQSFKIHIQSLEIRGPKPNFEEAFRVARGGRADALMIVANPLVGVHRQEILDLANKNRLPSMVENLLWAERGALMYYGVDLRDSYRRAGTYIEKILKGAKPAELPIEQPTKFELVINLKTAKQIGLTIPPNLLVRATRVIR